MRCLFSFIIVFLFGISFCSAQNEDDDNLLLGILHQNGRQFDSILNNKEKFRLQIIFTQVDRDKNNQPHLTTYCIDTGKYFYYPASMVKLPEVAFAIEKINKLSRSHPVSIYDSLVVSGDACGDLNEINYRKRSNFSTPAQLIKEMLLVSNNHAFNPLYDFLTQSYFNKRAHDLGYSSVVICNRFASCDSFQNRISSAVAFYDRATGKLNYLQSASVNREQPIVTSFNTRVGRGFMNGTAIDGPKDFCYNNYISLGDLHSLLVNLMFPQLQHRKQRMNLDLEDYAFLKKYMGMYPRESVSPKYDTVQNPDNVMKYFLGLADNSGHAPKNIRVFNKVGQAYGFTTDCSYVVDTLNKVEFFISCSMYTNKDEILNDGVYEYESIALPFFRNLFAAIYQHEMVRPKKYEPVFEDWDFTDTPF